LFCESFGTLGSIAGYNSWSFKPSNQEPTFTNYEDPWQVQMEDFDYQTNLYNKAA
jgi:hypothetical protein